MRVTAPEHDADRTERLVGCVTRFPHRGRHLFPDLGERVVRMSSILAAPSAVAILSTALSCGASGTATAQTPTVTTAAVLPGITVQAPIRIARPRQATKPPQRPTRVANRVESRPTSPATPFTAAEESVLKKLRRIERTTTSCDGGCQTSFPSGGRPWIGCSASSWPIGSGTCKNGRKYKTYVECAETSYLLAWKPMEVWWYCSSLAFNK